MVRLKSSCVLCLVLIGVFSAATAENLPPAEVVSFPEAGLDWVSDSAFVVTSGLADDVVLPRVEALRIIRLMNDGMVENFGYTDWRLPELHELEALQVLEEEGQLERPLQNFEMLKHWLTDRSREMEAPSPGSWTTRIEPRAASDKIYTWPVRGAHVLPGFAQAVVVATNSIHLKNNTVIQSGNLIANQVSPGPTLSGNSELTIGEVDVLTGGESNAFSNLKGDSVKIHRKAVINGDVHYNELDNNGTINGALITPLSLPVFTSLPPFKMQTPAPGSPNVTVPGGMSQTLLPGDYGVVTVGDNGTLLFSGGIYNLTSLTAGIGSQLLFDGPTQVRIQNSMSTAQNSVIGPSTGAASGGLSAKDIMFYVAGVNSLPGESPEATRLGRLSQVRANFYVPNGTLRVLRDAVATGAFIGRDVAVENSGRLILDSFYRNRPPQAGNDSLTVDEGLSTSVLDSGAASVLANDTDPNVDDLLSASLSTAPNHGTLIFNVDGTFQYTHDGSETTSDSFQYVVCDDGTPQMCATGTVSITINPVNDPPVAQNDSATTDEDMSVSVFVLANDSDVDGNLDPETLTVVQGPANGTTIVFGPDIGYFPAANFNGMDSFQYEICDDGTPLPSLCATATVVVTVNPVPDVPIALPDFFTVLEGGTLSDNVATNDFDPDGDALTFNLVSSPAAGNLSFNSNGTFTYIHGGSELPSDNFIYLACDGITGCGEGLATIQVIGVNDAPTANSQIVQTNGTSAITITLTGSDPENDDLLFSIFSGPSQGVLGPVIQGPAPVNPGDPPRTSATVQYTPNTGDDLEDSFVFEVDDQNGGTSTGTVFLNPDDTAESPPPDDPIAVVTARDRNLETTETVLVVFEADAPTGVSLSFSIQTLPNGSLANSEGTAIESVPAGLPDARVFYTPPPGAEDGSVDSFNFQAIGSNAQTSTASVNVTFAEPVELAPNQQATTNMNQPVQINLQVNPGGTGTITPQSGSADKARLQKPGSGTVHASIPGASLAGNVGDADLDGIGDGRDAIPGPAPVLISAAVDRNLSSQTFNDETAFQSSLVSSSFFDFETSSGFPPTGTIIGTFQGIGFDAKTFESATLATSGVQTMTGSGSGAGTFSPATLDFTGLELKPNAFGFRALDLTLGEIIRVTVEYAAGPNTVYDVQLASGEPAFTKIYFGVSDTSRVINRITFVGTDTAGANRAWAIDDLRVGRRTLVAGVARIHIEYDISTLRLTPAQITSARVVLHTQLGTVDSLPTSFFSGDAEQDGRLKVSDFQAPATAIPGAVMPVPTGSPVGTQGTFTFDVKSALQSAMNAGRSFFSIQGRVDEALAGQGSQRGLQIRSSATGNLNSNLEPLLELQADGPPILTLQVTTLPTNGTLKDLSGNLVVAGQTFAGPQTLLYTPNLGFSGNDSFNYQVTEGLVVDSATVGLLVLIDENCVINGREPGCAPGGSD